MSTVLLATRNTKKLEELRRLVTSVEVIGLADVEPYDEVPESGLTFESNALIKAREGVAHTGLPTIADDSGLSVDVLNGMPGIFSARWSGGHGSDQANLTLLLAQIHDIADEHRGASFVCAAALVLPSGESFTTTGTMTGMLIREPRGMGGFGYDPIFVPEGETRTNAELTAEEKDAISHRGKAFRALAPLVLAAL